MSILELIRQNYPDAISLAPNQIAKILNCHVRSVNRGLADGSLQLKSFASTANRKRVLITDLVAYLERPATSPKRGRPIGSKNRKAA